MAKDIKKKKKSMKKKLVITLLIILIAISSILIYSKFIKKEDIVKKENVIDKIAEYGYTVSDNDTKLFKQLFSDLKDELNKESVDKKKYAKLISELFIVDFFNLDNKITKNDVGGVQFVYSPYKQSFIDKSRDEFYRYIENNLNGDRKQNLPIVKSIEVKDIKEVNKEDVFNENEDDEEDENQNKITLDGINEIYEISVSWEYKDDLKYQDEANLIVVNEGDKKLSIAKLYSNSDEED